MENYTCHVKDEILIDILVELHREAFTAVEKDSLLESSIIKELIITIDGNGPLNRVSTFSTTLFLNKKIPITKCVVSVNPVTFACCKVAYCDASK